ncbi:MAG: hypothetical protein KAR44_14200 [Candidatus Aegiribacteria sp.]|nr:hypothetical protein [Candidatus Aegiribacteria sp.]
MTALESTAGEQDLSFTSPPISTEGWCDPTGAPGDNWSGGITVNPNNANPWPSSDVTYFNLIDLSEFDLTGPVQVEQIEVACQNSISSSGGVQENLDTGSWNTAPYPSAAWHNFPYTIPVKVTDDKFWIGFHGYLPDFAFGYEYVPGPSPYDREHALYNAGVTGGDLGLYTLTEIIGSLNGGAFGLRCYVTETGMVLEQTSWGAIKSSFRGVE